MSSIEYINSIVLTAPAASISFINIPDYYEDLKVTFSSTNLGNDYSPAIRFNSATSLYSFTRITGNGSSVASYRASNYGWIIGSFGTVTNYLFSGEIDILSYSNNNIFKTCLISNGNASNVGVVNLVGLWRSTDPISEINFIGNLATSTAEFASGSTFTLWGVR